MLLSTHLSFPLLSLSLSICLQSSSFLLREVIAMFDQSAWKDRMSVSSDADVVGLPDRERQHKSFCKCSCPHCLSMCKSRLLCFLRGTRLWDETLILWPFVDRRISFESRAGYQLILLILEPIQYQSNKRMPKWYIRYSDRYIRISILRNRKNLLKWEKCMFMWIKLYDLYQDISQIRPSSLDIQCQFLYQNCTKKVSRIDTQSY